MHISRVNFGKGDIVFNIFQRTGLQKETKGINYKYRQSLLCQYAKYVIELLQEPEKTHIGHTINYDG